jgi:L-malate glycosyltransferase
MASEVKPAVLVLQRVVPAYRVPFFRALTAELYGRGIDLEVVSSSAAPRSGNFGFRHHYAPVSLGGLSALETINRERPKVLVLPHSARFASLAATTRLLQGRGERQLLWGMGISRRYTAHSGSDPRPVGEAVRRAMLLTCDHYLSYTELSTANVAATGYDPARITTVNNAVNALASPQQASAADRVPLQVLFVASLAADKEPLAAVAIVGRLRLLAPGATLHIVGDGPLRPMCEAAAYEREWVRYHGPQWGEGLRDLALGSDIALIPGRVGLAVLEMASAGLPMATFAFSRHGAEIAYLQDGLNGLLLDADINGAAKQLGALLADRPTLERMRGEALAMANRYTISSMAANFADGVTANL